MEKYVWSLDVSTTNIGSALWDINGKLIELKHLELKIDKSISVDDRIIHKAEIFRKYCEEYKERILNELNGSLEHIIIEEPLFGSNNANTVSLLYGFNGICRYILYKTFSKYPTKVSVHDSRKIFLPEFVKQKTAKGEISEVLSFPKGWKSEEKKKYIWEKVAKLEPQIKWFYKTDNITPKDINFDMSDSYCVGYSGMVLLNIIK